MGTISFFVLAIPITLLLIHDAIGEVIVNAIIPSMYSGLLIACAALYAVSLTALLVPLVIIVGVCLFVPFVYRPSFAAYERRNVYLKKAQVAGSYPVRINHVKSSTSGPWTCWNDFLKYVWRVSFIAIHSMQHSVVMLSTRAIDIRREKKLHTDKVWRDMNLKVVSEEVLVDDDDKWRRYASDENFLATPARSEYSNFSFKNANTCPVKISNMVSSTGEIGTVDPKEERLRLRAMRGLTRVEGDKVIMRSGEYVHVQLHSYYVFTPKEAISIIRGRLSPDSVSVSEEYLEVIVPDLYREFQNIFKNFYPDGILMSETEIDEASENFTTWKNALKLRQATAIKDDVACSVEIIDFQVFQEWFEFELIDSIHSIAADRLLNHTLLQDLSIRMRLSDIAVPRVLGNARSKQVLI